MRVKCFAVLFTVVSMLLMTLNSGTVVAEGGFDDYGYNYNARIFVGVGENWYRGKQGLPVWHEGDPFLWDPVYGRDQLVMKWSKAWDNARFHGAEWNPDAWCTNEWNGMVLGGSQETWRYVNIWVGPELEGSPYWREGGYPIWGQFEVIMSHGTVEGEHFWDCLATPGGLGGP